MGPIKVPLLLHNRTSHGGGAILCDCIVRLIVNFREVYRHPEYKVPEFTIHSGDGKLWVREDGKDHASFNTREQAERWIAFMQGARMTK